MYYAGWPLCNVGCLVRNGEAGWLPRARGRDAAIGSLCCTRPFVPPLSCRAGTGVHRS